MSNNKVIKKNKGIVFFTIFFVLSLFLGLLTSFLSLIILSYISGFTILKVDIFQIDFLLIWGVVSISLLIWFISWGNKPNE
jgi:hypothetical protein